MPVKVELHPDVSAALKLYDDLFQDSFFERLHALRDRPLEESEAFYDPALSQYRLRFFAFGPADSEIAIFLFDAFEQRIRVLECRTRKRKRSGG